MLLDDLRTVEVDARGRTNRGTWGSSSDESLAIPIIAAWCWDLRAPFLRDYALLLWRCGFDDSRYLVESLARNGDFTEARAAALEHQRDGQPRSLDEIRLLPAIHGLADAAEGKVEPALKRLSVCMDLFPFDPRPGMAILGAFRERGRHDVAERATQRIRDHWQQRLLEHPHSIEVSEGARYWLGELERTAAIR